MAFSLFFGVNMPDFQGIQDKVTRRLIDGNAAITAEVPDLVNNALRRIQNLHNFRIMAENIELTTTQADSILATVPPNATPDIPDWKASRDSPWVNEWDGGSTLIEWGPSQHEIVKIFPVDDDSITGQGSRNIYYGMKTILVSFHFPMISQTGLRLMLVIGEFVSHIGNTFQP